MFGKNKGGKRATGETATSSREQTRKIIKSIKLRNGHSSVFTGPRKYSRQIRGGGQGGGFY